jgi:hypothetical protein
MAKRKVLKTKQSSFGYWKVWKGPTHIFLLKRSLVFIDYPQFKRPQSDIWDSMAEIQVL